MNIYNHKVGLPWLVLLLVTTYFSFFFNLGSYPLLNNNEGLYASIAQYMLLHKSFIIPHLNCVPYIEKPPLLYWLLTASFAFFGMNAWAARLVTILAATGVAIALLTFTTKLSRPKVGFLAALIFTSSIGVAIIARMVYFDMLLTLLITVALLALFYWQQTTNKFALRLSYAALALACLTKGLVALVIVFGSYGLFLLLEKNFWQGIKAMIDLPGIGLFLLIALPWHIAASIAHPSFFRNYVIGEQFLRFLNLREPHDYYHGTIFYYLPRMLIYLFPWSLFAPLLFWREQTGDQFIKKLLRFAWCWLLIPLLFFSCSSAKANYYMIVAMPAVAIILAIKIEQLDWHKLNIWSTIFFVLIAMALSIGLMFANPYLSKFAINSSLIVAVAVYCTLASIILFALCEKVNFASAIIATLIIPCSIAITQQIRAMSTEISAADAGAFIAQLPNTEHVYLYQDFENFSALPFYAQSCIKIIDTQSSDLYYGAHLPSSKSWFVTSAEIAKKLPKDALFIVANKKLTQLQSAFVPMSLCPYQKFGPISILHACN